MRTSHMSSSRQFLCGVRPQRNARRRSLFHMSAARGDACLAAAANALGAGDIVGAQENLDKARMEYMRAGVDDRNELVEQIRSRVEIALNQETRDAKKIDSASEFAERLRLSKQEGDNVMSEAAKMLSRKNFEAARMLALKARDLFQQASPEIARERQAVLGNLMSYIQIEEEREALMKKRKARKEREDREQRELEERLEQAAMAVMEGEPVQKRPTNPPLASTRLPCLAVAEAGELPDLCMLVDNGSSRAATTLELRRISQRLGDAIGMPVLPVSMAHADKASLEQLGGKPAKLFLDELRARCLQDSVSSVVVVPLFFGPTLAVSSKIPDALKEVAAEKSVQAAAAFKEASLKWSVADPLCEDAGLAPLLAQEIERAIATHRSECADASAMPSVVLVDHGSPSPKVAGVRDAVAEALSKTLTGRLAQSVTAASMERRPGPEYAFCDPLLSDALPRIGDGESDVVLSLMFLLPGTHAGPQGDIDQICEAALDEAGVKRRVVKTRLVGELDGLVQLLVRRFAHALARL